MAETNPTDNVIVLSEGPPAPKQLRRKDPRAAARQAKKRSKNKADRDAGRRRSAPVVIAEAPPIVPAVALAETPSAPVPTASRPDVLPYIAAVALAGAAAWFSIRGMVVLFPGAPQSVVMMACAMEGAKLVTAGWLARRWRATAWIWRAVLVALVAGLAVINAAGVYAQLVAAHVGERGAAAAAIETKDAALAARIEVAAGRVADFDRQIAQIDNAVAAATQRGKTNTALAAMDGQKKARAGLAGDRQREAAALADLKAERAAIGAAGRQLENDAAPIRYVAELLGIEADSERAIRWLIALMVMCCDPLAIALTAAASARR